MFLQNQLGLDLLTVKEGRLCLFLQEECCFYVNQSSILKNNFKTIKNNSMPLIHGPFENSHMDMNTALPEPSSHFSAFIMCALFHQTLLHIPPITNPKIIEPISIGSYYSIMYHWLQRSLLPTNFIVLMVRISCIPKLMMILDIRKQFKKYAAPIPASPLLHFFTSLYEKKKRGMLSIRHLHGLLKGTLQQSVVFTASS